MALLLHKPLFYNSPKPIFRFSLGFSGHGDDILQQYTFRSIEFETKAAREVTVDEFLDDFSPDILLIRIGGKPWAGTSGRDRVNSFTGLLVLGSGTYLVYQPFIACGSRSFHQSTIDGHIR